jgi:hypothetical protein
LTLPDEVDRASPPAPSKHAINRKQDRQRNADSGAEVAMVKWIQAHQTVLGWLAALSVVMFLAALVLVPWVVIRLPADYFAGPRRDRSRYLWRRPVLRIAWLAGKNLAGVLLVLAGIAMLVLPGQGILTILIGVTLMDFPGKYRVERWIVQWPPVLGAINALRRRAGRGPLQFDSAQAPDGGEADPESREQS